MGVDPNRLPQPAAWLERLLPDLPFYLGWDCDGVRVGHCNVNQLLYGERAYLHLHLWDALGA